MELKEYLQLINGCSVVVLLLNICVLALLSSRLLSELFQKLLRIHPVKNLPSYVNFYGISINIKSSRRFRFSLIIQLSLKIWIIIVLFLDGCGMQTHFLSMKDLCSSSIENSDCFRFGKYEKGERVLCQSGKFVSNVTSSTVICFVWVYAEQNTLSAINQMGICSSVFALLCVVFQCFCRLSRQWWGLALVILSLVICIIIPTISAITEVPFSMTANRLLMVLSCIIINVLQLRQFTHHCKHYRPVPVTVIQRKGLHLTEKIDSIRSPI